MVKGGVVQGFVDGEGFDVGEVIRTQTLPVESFRSAEEVMMKEFTVEAEGEGVVTNRG